MHNINHLRLLLLLMCFTSTYLFAQTRVVGYISADSKRYRENQIEIPKGVTDIVVAIAVPANDGKLIIPGDWEIVDKWSKVLKPDSCRLWLAIGGGIEKAEIYRNRIIENQDEFIADILQIAKLRGLDGIDLDIEGHLLVDSIIPPTVYEQFVVKLSKALHDENKQLSGAVATWFGLQITPATLRAFDFVNVMSYDATGPWSPDKPGQHSPLEMMKYDFDYWSVNRGVPADRVNLGIPFYGYTFSSKGVSQIGYSSIVHVFHGSPRKDHLSTRLPFIRHEFWYNGKPMVRKKAQFALASAGGIMIWELGQDCTEKHHSLLRVIVKEIEKTARQK